RALDLGQRCGEPRWPTTLTPRSSSWERARAGGRRRVDALTPAESRVAELVVAGKKNREIAGILYVSLRTVELHLTSIYRKLSVSNRAELIGES
uniref:helix-turn-helix domain-containing protein n=1 Tax=Sphingopyxis terrae TaxID=33052 RepID=UPI0036D38384